MTFFEQNMGVGVCSNLHWPISRSWHLILTLHTCQTGYPIIRISTSLHNSTNPLSPPGAPPHLSHSFNDTSSHGHAPGGPLPTLPPEVESLDDNPDDDDAPPPLPRLPPPAYGASCSFCLRSAAFRLATSSGVSPPTARIASCGISPMGACNLAWTWTSGFPSGMPARAKASFLCCLRAWAEGSLVESQLVILETPERRRSLLLEGVGDLVSLRSEVLVRGVEDEVRLPLRGGWLGGGGEGGLDEVFGGSMDRGREWGCDGYFCCWRGCDRREYDAS